MIRKRQELHRLIIIHQTTNQKMSGHYFHQKLQDFMPYLNRRQATLFSKKVKTEGGTHATKRPTRTRVRSAISLSKATKYSQEN